MKLELETATRNDLSTSPPERIARATMVQRWGRLTFIHWPTDVEAVRGLLPSGLEVDTFDGTAWVGLILFTLRVRKPPSMPVLPWAATTPEANVRTYVRGSDGCRGIWFFSLDAARLGPVVLARLWYRLPYMWARMRYWSNGTIVRYESRRRSPSPSGTGFRATLCLGEEFSATRLSPLERFLICRWRLYSPTTNGIAVTQVEHEPWPLRRARVLHLEEDLLAGLGLPKISEPPLAHYSPGVETRFGPRRMVERPETGAADIAG
jgi:uncharacterized protein YqjF (DUF2071 family)